MAIGIPGETVRAGGGQVASGQQYAQQIAGGMPMSQVIAPGVSYSTEQPGGYTQADLNVIANLGIAPVMPSAPTQGPSYTIEDQMPYAPPGVTQPTPYLPPNTTVRDLTPTPEIEDYLQFIPNLVLPTDVPFNEISADTSFAPDLSQDGNFFVPNKFDLDVEAILEGVDPDKLADIDLSNIDLPDSRGRPGIDYFPEPRDPFFVKDFFEDPTSSKNTAGLLDPQLGSSAPINNPLVNANSSPIKFDESTGNINFFSDASSPLGATQEASNYLTPDQINSGKVTINYQPVPESERVVGTKSQTKGGVLQYKIETMADGSKRITNKDGSVTIEPAPLPVSQTPAFVQPNIDEIVKPISRQNKFLTQPGLFQLA